MSMLFRKGPDSEAVAGERFGVASCVDSALKVYRIRSIDRPPRRVRCAHAGGRVPPPDYSLAPSRVAFLISSAFSFRTDTSSSGRSAPRPTLVPNRRDSSLSVRPPSAFPRDLEIARCQSFPPILPARMGVVLRIRVRPPDRTLKVWTIFRLQRRLFLRGLVGPDLFHGRKTCLPVGSEGRGGLKKGVRGRVFGRTRTECRFR